MAIEIFNRREKKYMLDESTYLEMLERIGERMESDSYSREGGFYSICNIYYDTENDTLIRKSVDKPVYKEKLRLRTYGTPKSGSMAFIEIKKKYNDVVNKRRIVLPLWQAKAYLDEGARPDYEGVNAQILRELDYFTEFYKLMPKVCISYDRRAYFDREDEGFRVTFDTNIRSRRTGLSLETGPYGEPLLKPGQWLMEVKISDAMPRWFGSILSELKLYPVSFSKYGTEYCRYIRENIEKGEKNKCLTQLSAPRTRRYQPAHQC